MEKAYVFKGYVNEKSKRTGRPFTMVKLHDPVTLDNTDFFLQDDVEINFDGLKFKDNVVATLDIGVNYGKTTVNLLGLKKAQ